VSRKYAFIASEEGNYPMHLMFRWAKVSKSGFYEWKGRGPSHTCRRRELLGRLITALFEASDGTYGYRRIHADLRRSGYWADDETVRQIMRELELVPCQPRPFRPITTIAGDTGQTPDLFKRDFTASVPGTKLVGDNTYIPTWGGLAVPGDRPGLRDEEGRRVRDGRSHADLACDRRPEDGS